jgi:hypothetical protein
VTSAGTENLPVRNGVASVQSMRVYTRQRLQQGHALRALVRRGSLPADLRIATAGAGALPYVSDLYTVDVLGLNDEDVARSIEADPTRRLGHQKHASRALLRSRDVDMLDVAGGFVFSGEPTPLVLTRAQRRLSLFNATTGVVPLTLQCRVVPGGYLLFATALPPTEVDQRFASLTACPVEWWQPRGQSA